MIKSNWSEQQAKDYLQRYPNQDLALRIYTSHLIGKEPNLVLHGGGNTSVKSSYTNILGQTIEAIYVKGSGADLADLDEKGLPGLDLNYLRELRKLDKLSDEEMVNQLRTHMFDFSAPTPSVETLLHAFLPAKYIDHSHADAILALTNSEASAIWLEECFGSDVIYVPYVMPGFVLAKLCADCFERESTKKVMILLKHGLFTWGESARDAYELHIETVQRAESYLQKKLKSSAPKSIESSIVGSPEKACVLPALRGALAVTAASGSINKRFILELRQSSEIDSFINAKNKLSLSQSAPLTPDHIIRTKAVPLILELAGSESNEQLREKIEAALKLYATDYERYFQHCSQARAVKKEKLDSKPRVILIPGLGLVTCAESKSAAKIVADIYEHTISVKLKVNQLSSYQGLPQEDLFDVEYWSLEQAKLGKLAPKPLQGQVALISGAAGAIGIGIAKVLKQAGAEVIVTDISNSKELADELGVYGWDMDVSSENSVAASFSKAISEFGGLDIVVPNAGIAVSGTIENTSSQILKKVFEVNFNGVFNTIREGAKILKRQGNGGNIVIISTKNVFAPGKEFGLYSSSKAAAHQIGKIAALELAGFGIRVNMVNPDAVFGTIDHPSKLWQSVGPDRAKAHGIEFQNLPDFYKHRNLLKTTVTAEDVGRAVLFFASNQTPTTGASLAVDGGIAEAFAR